MLFRLLRAHLGPYSRDITLLVLLQLVSTIGMLYLPTLNADIIDSGVLKGDTGYILRVGAVMVGVSLAQAACSIGAVYYGARTAMSVGRDVRAAVFSRVQDFSARELNQFGAPSLITRTTNDVQQVQMLALMTFTLMVAAPIMCVGGVVMALNQDVPLSGLLLAVVPLLGAVVTVLVGKMRPQFRGMQTRIDAVNRIMREQITGIRVIRAFVKDDHERARFSGANGELADYSLRVGRLMSLMFPIVMGVVNVSSVAVFWFGAHRIQSGGMQIGALTAFLSYLMQILMSVMMATFMFMMVPRAEVCAERIQEVLDTESSVVPPLRPVTELHARGTLELRGVDFRYPGAEVPVLRGIDLTARAGETTAVIGSTGSGKTTLLGLVPRLFDATGGTVLIDGVDVRELDRGSCPRSSASSRRSRTCSPAPSPPTCATASPRPPMRSSGRRWRPRRPRTSSGSSPRAWTPRSPRAAPTSPAASASAWRSPARWSAGPRSTCSTTPSRPSTTPPTPGCAPRSPGRPGTPPW